jgi:hypothetical protein
MMRALRLMALISLTLAAFGERIPGQYIVELTGAPAGLAAAGKGRLAMASARSRVQAAQEDRPGSVAPIEIDRPMVGGQAGEARGGGRRQATRPLRGLFERAVKGELSQAVPIPAG